MPEPLKTLQNQTGHRTRAEKERRESAEESLRRDRVNIRAPKWLSLAAREVWDSTKRKLRGLDLLDNVDAELLGIYCDACAHYQETTRLLRLTDENGKLLAGDDEIKAAQAWARIVSAYAERLGLSPTARARLARRKAVKEEPDELESLLNEFTGIVNGVR